MTAVREARIQPEVFDDDDILLPLAEHAPHGALRLPDGRAMAWASTAAPADCRACWSPTPDRPGWRRAGCCTTTRCRRRSGCSPWTDRASACRTRSASAAPSSPAEDLRRMVETLAVGRVAVIGIGQGADDALAFAARYPALVTSVSAVSVRLPADGTETPLDPASRSPAGTPGVGPDRCASWIAAAGKDADLTDRGHLVADAGPARRGVRPGAG